VEQADRRSSVRRAFDGVADQAGEVVALSVGTARLHAASRQDRPKVRQDRCSTCAVRSLPSEGCSSADVRAIPRLRSRFRHGSAGFEMLESRQWQETVKMVQDHPNCPAESRTWTPPKWRNVWRTKPEFGNGDEDGKDDDLGC